MTKSAPVTTIASVACCALLPLLALLLFPANPERFPEFGENDFIQYWAAHQLYARGADPYDPRLMMAVERARGWNEAHPLMMWNPPWVLTLLSPLLRFDLDTSSRLFLGFNMALLITAGMLTLRALSAGAAGYPALIAVGLISFPVFLVLKLGQISPLITLAVSLLMYAVSAQRYFLLGMALALLTAKLHPAYLLLVPAVLLLNRSNLKPVVFGFAIPFVLLLAIQHLQSPDALLHWLTKSKHNGDPLLRSVYSWKTTTLSTFARSALFSITGELPRWPMFAIPLLSALALFAWIKSRKLTGTPEMFALLLPVSCFTSAFGWIYDGSICSITQLWILFCAFGKDADRRRRWVAVLGLTALHTGLFAHYWAREPLFDAYWYFFPALFVLGIWSGRRTRGAS